MEVRTRPHYSRTRGPSSECYSPKKARRTQEEILPGGATANQRGQERIEGKRSKGSGAGNQRGQEPLGDQRGQEIKGVRADQRGQGNQRGQEPIPGFRLLTPFPPDPFSDLSARCGPCLRRAGNSRGHPNERPSVPQVLQTRADHASSPTSRESTFPVTRTSSRAKSSDSHRATEAG